uniref:RRM domain-containing protein n=1 Tax=Lotharella oceanica TaxID=641309 RepID=A0A7S2TVQ5_9EUKA
MPKRKKEGPVRKDEGGKKKKKGKLENARGLVLPKGYRILRLKLSENTVAVRYLYFKRHTSSSPGEQGPTLFVTNIPSNFDFQNVTNLFSLYGDVEGVEFVENLYFPGVSAEKPRSARVIFENEEAIEKIMSVSKKDVVAPYEPPNLATGMKKYLMEYKRERPDTEKLQIQVDRFMEAFDVRAKEEKENLDVKEVDEDGFELVKRKSRKMRGSVAPKITEIKQKKRKEPVVNFYRDQKRLQQAKKLALLRKKFEEDRQRIAEMRQNRKFKPY